MAEGSWFPWLRRDNGANTASKSGRTSDSPTKFTSSTKFTSPLAWAEAVPVPFQILHSVKLSGEGRGGERVDSSFSRADAQAGDLHRVREVLGGKLQGALRDEVGLLERIEVLEANKAKLEEKLAALQEGQGGEVPCLSVQLAAGESERLALQEAEAVQRLANEEVIWPEFVVCSFAYASTYLFSNIITKRSGLCFPAWTLN